ncbi:MAG: hypothetical protein M1421_08200 [Candidatus Eremiobacteraeota bacterium]|nr:hypothetical protein [Candidatus Eremiobacteraeota bacterium]
MNIEDKNALKDFSNYIQNLILQIFPGSDNLFGFSVVTDFFSTLNNFFDEKNQEIIDLIEEGKKKGIQFQKGRLVMVLSEFFTKLK